MHILLAGLLILEGIGTALRVAALVPSLGAYDALARFLIFSRGVTGAMALTSGWWLIRRRPTAPVLASAALVISAICTTLEAGFLLAPTSVSYDSWRWSYVAASWMYAIAWVMWLRASPADPPRR